MDSVVCGRGVVALLREFGLHDGHVWFLLLGNGCYFQVIKNTLNPVWRPFEMSTQKLCSNDCYQGARERTDRRNHFTFSTVHVNPLVFGHWTTLVCHHLHASCDHTCRSCDFSYTCPYTLCRWSVMTGMQMAVTI